MPSNGGLGIQMGVSQNIGKARQNQPNKLGLRMGSNQRSLPLILKKGPSGLPHQPLLFTTIEEASPHCSAPLSDGQLDDIEKLVDGELAEEERRLADFEEELFSEDGVPADEEMLAADETLAMDMDGEHYDGEDIDATQDFA